MAEKLMDEVFHHPIRADAIEPKVIVFIYLSINKTHQNDWFLSAPHSRSACPVKGGVKVMQASIWPFGDPKKQLWPARGKGC